MSDGNVEIRHSYGGFRVLLAKLLANSYLGGLLRVISVPVAVIELPSQPEHPSVTGHGGAHCRKQIRDHFVGIDSEAITRKRFADLLGDWDKQSLPTEVL